MSSWTVERKVEWKIESFCHTFSTMLNFEIKCWGENRVKNRVVWPGPNFYDCLRQLQASLRLLTIIGKPALKDTFQFIPLVFLLKCFFINSPEYFPCIFPVLHSHVLVFMWSCLLMLIQFMIKALEMAQAESKTVVSIMVALKSRVISRGAKGDRAPLVKSSAYFGGLSPPNILALAWLSRVYWSCFQSAMINCALLYGYWHISYCWLYNISIKLNYYVSIFEKLGVVVAGPHPNYGQGCA